MDSMMALIGGVLLGISVVGYLYLCGGIAGVSGLLGQIFQPKQFVKSTAFWFLLGLVLTPIIYAQYVEMNIQVQSSISRLIVAGLLVGVGTALASGCTSGHGICGLSRLSKRSMVATATFMLMGMCTVYVMRHVLQ